MTTDDDSTITSDDVLHLNRTTLDRAAELTRQIGMAVLAIGAIGIAAWIYYQVRQQQLIGDQGGGGFGMESSDVSFQQRVDVLASSVTPLMLAGLALGAGIALRLVADYAVLRTGGSLSVFDVGDSIPDEPDETDAEEMP